MRRTFIAAPEVNFGPYRNTRLSRYGAYQVRDGHEAAAIHQLSRRRGCVAGGGTGAAIIDAGDWNAQLAEHWT